MESKTLSLTIDTPGELTALILYFTLDMHNGHPHHTLSTGPDSPSTAWEQRARYLPLPLSVMKGDLLHLTALRSECYLTTVEISGFTSDMLTSSHGIRSLVGHPQAKGMGIVMQPSVASTREELQAIRTPRMSYSDAISHENDENMAQLFEAHGYLIIHDIPKPLLDSMSACDTPVTSLLKEHCDRVQPRAAVKTIAKPITTTAATEARPPLAVAKPVAKPATTATPLTKPIAKPTARKRSSLRIPSSTTTASNENHPNLRLPLDRVGVHVERERGQLVRVQLHLLTDDYAMRMVPWAEIDTAPQRDTIQGSIAKATAAFHGLSTQLLTRLAGGKEVEVIRSGLASAHGDPSCLDINLYPNSSSNNHEEEDSLLNNMREHTDPGLLTLTLASRVPGLQVRDNLSGEWRDVEACCEAGTELIVLGCEALEFASEGKYRAATHRVARRPATPRISTVFELRMPAA